VIGTRIISPACQFLEGNSHEGIHIYIIVINLNSIANIYKYSPSLLQVLVGRFYLHLQQHFSSGAVATSSH
jgi:hypothetical protein